MTKNQMSTPGTGLSVYALSAPLGIAPTAAAHGTAVPAAAFRVAALPVLQARGAPV